MELLKVLPRLLTNGFTSRISKQDGLINTTDLLVATAATVILATGVGGAVIGTLDGSRYGKAQPDAQTLAVALAQFYKDTGRWPGQAEHAAIPGATKPAVFLVSAGVTDTTVLPEATGTALSVATAACSVASLEGFSGVSITAGTLETATRLNINDYLVRKPDETRYPNWKGPYLQQEVKTDPWDRAWVLNLQPLYCAETILDATGTVSALTSGNLGYAWILSGGTNKTSQRCSRLDNSTRTAKMPASIWVRF
jgi:hypothetical protein